MLETDLENVEGLGNAHDSFGDYPIDELLIRHESITVHEVIRLLDQSRYVLDPDFQRDFIWSENQQSKLIESVAMRIPLPVFYLAEDSDGRKVVVDGLQRLSTFKRFISDELSLKLKGNSALNRQRFSRLPPKIQNRVEGCNLVLYIIDSKVPERIRLEMFDRVNSGTRLSRQQMRNCLWMGKATRLLKDEAKSGIFHDATGGSLSRKTMRDREFVNRYCAFQFLGAEEYKGDMDNFLAQCLDRMNRMSSWQLDQLSIQFRRGLDNNFLLFGRHAFRIRQRNSEIRCSLNAAYWDVMSVLLSEYEKGHVMQSAEKIRIAASHLLSDDDFDASISYGPNDAKKVKTRFLLARSILFPALSD